MVRGAVNAMLVGFAKEYARFKAYHRHVTAGEATTVIQGLTTTAVATIQPDGDCKLKELLVTVPDLCDLLSATTSEVTCIEWKAVQFGDFKIEDGRHFVYEAGATVVSLGSVFSMRSINGHYVILFREYHNFDMKNGSIHASIESLLPPLRAIEFNSKNISFSKSEHFDRGSGVLHIHI